MADNRAADRKGIQGYGRPGGNPLQSLWNAIEAMPSQPSLELSAATYRILFALLILGAATLQLLLYFSGLYSISADESARALVAHDLTVDNAFQLTFWPPFNKIVNGLALKIYDDLYVTPRILTGLLGLGTIAAVTMTARRMFENNLVALLAGVLAVALPQRLILSVAPLSDMGAYFLTMLAAAFLVTWLKTDNTRSLFIASALVLLASMVRFESWFLNAVLGLYLAWRFLIARNLPLLPFLVAGALVAAFPVYWLAKLYLLDGNLARLSGTSAQFIDVFGRNYLQALKLDTLMLFAKDTLMNPAALAGAIGLVLVVLNRRVLRPWVMLVYAPLFLIGAMMMVSFSIPTAAPFRTDGIWILALLPFAAYLMVTLADHLRASDQVRFIALIAMAYMSFMTSLTATHDIVKGYHAGAKDLIVADDLVMGRALRAHLASDPRNLLVDAIDNLSYLNAAVVANAPAGRTIANVDADLVIAGLYSNARQVYIARGQRDIVETYLTDKFRIENGLDPVQLKTRNVGFLLMRNAGYVAACDANPLLEKLDVYGGWHLYRVKA